MTIAEAVALGAGHGFGSGKATTVQATGAAGNGPPLGNGEPVGPGQETVSSAIRAAGPDLPDLFPTTGAPARFYANPSDI